MGGWEDEGGSGGGDEGCLGIILVMFWEGGQV